MVNRGRRRKGLPVENKPEITQHPIWERPGAPLQECHAGTVGGGVSSQASGEAPRDVRVFFQNGDCESLLVSPVGANLYRSEQTSLLGEMCYFDTIEAETQSDGTLRMLRVAARSGLKTFSCFLSLAQFESPELAAFLHGVAAAGGLWERVFGGGLILHLPPGHEYLAGAVDNLFSEQRKSAENG